MDYKKWFRTYYIMVRIILYNVKAILILYDFIFYDHSLIIFCPLFSP